jgi:hypothetical protein
MVQKVLRLVARMVGHLEGFVVEGHRGGLVAADRRGDLMVQKVLRLVARMVGRRGDLVGGGRRGGLVAADRRVDLMVPEMFDPHMGYL